MTRTLRFERLIAAPFTAFHPGGEVNLDCIADQAALLRDSSVQGAFVCGTTGEGSSLSIDERKLIAARWMKEAAGLEIIVHAGHTNVPEASELIRHAAAIGANAVAVTAPYYFRPNNAQDLVVFLSEVASAAPKLPFYFYDIPSTTRVTLPTIEVLRRAKESVPNLAGVKFSNSDLISLQECVQFDQGKMQVLFGVDEYLLSAVVLGATGAVGSTYNYAAPVYHWMLAAVRAGDLEAARNQQYQSALLVRALIDFGGIRAGKAIMAMLGVDCGPVRSPLRPMSPDEIRGLYERVKSLDVFAKTLQKPVN